MKAQLLLLALVAVAASFGPTAHAAGLRGDHVSTAAFTAASAGLLGAPAEAAGRKLLSTRKAGRRTWGSFGKTVDKVAKVITDPLDCDDWIKHQEDIATTQAEVNEAKATAAMLQAQIPAIAAKMDPKDQSLAQGLKHELDDLQHNRIPALQAKQQYLQAHKYDTLCGDLASVLGSLVDDVDHLVHDVEHWVEDNACDLVALGFTVVANALDMGLKALQPELEVDALVCNGIKELKYLPGCSGGMCVLQQEAERIGDKVVHLLCEYAPSSGACGFTPVEIFQIGWAMYDAACGNFVTAIWDVLKPYIMCDITVAGHNCGEKLDLQCPVQHRSAPPAPTPAPTPTPAAKPGAIQKALAACKKDPESPDCPWRTRTIAGR